MKLNIKCGIRGSRLCAENGELLGRVTRSPRRGRVLDIWDASGKPVGQLCAIDGGVQWTVPDGRKETAPFQYRMGEDGRPIQPSLVRPPMPVGLALDTRWGQLYITQNERREYQIFLDQKPIGNISRMLHKNKEIRTEDETLTSPEIYCLSYGIAWLLLQDDQIEI